MHTALTPTHTTSLILTPNIPLSLKSNFLAKAEHKCMIKFRCEHNSLTLNSPNATAHCVFFFFGLFIVAAL